MAGLRAYEYLHSSPSHAMAQWLTINTTQLPLRGQRWNVVSEYSPETGHQLPDYPKLMGTSGMS